VAESFSRYASLGRHRIAVNSEAQENFDDRFRVADDPGSLPSMTTRASHYASTTSLVRLSSALQLSGQPIDETLCDLKPSRKMATRASLAISEAHTR
jgi:hypothetical protein